MNPFIRQCIAALESAGSDSHPVPTGNVRDFLVEMQFIDGKTGHLDAAGKPKQALRVLQAAQYLDQLVPIASPHAPRLVMLGGLVRPDLLDPELAIHPAGSVTGSGVTMRDAFHACVGEAVEYLSQIERAGDLIGRGDGTTSPELGVYVDAIVSPELFVRGETLDSGEPAVLPADLCLRRRDMDASFGALSTGCGTGSNRSGAILHGLLELVERDAVALWWAGGAFGRPIDLTEPALAAACDRLTFLRDGADTRHTWLLDITSDLDIPCIAALSTDDGGLSVACGTAADTCPVSAAKRAIREMCQMEMAYDVLDAKRRERGEEAFNAADRRHQARRETLSANDCRLLHPSGVPRHQSGCPEVDVDKRLTWLGDRLLQCGHAVYVVNLTRHMIGIPTVRVFSPTLQLWPAQVQTPRLAARIEKTGGGSIHTMGVMPY